MLRNEEINFAVFKVNVGAVEQKVKTKVDVAPHVSVLERKQRVQNHHYQLVDGDDAGIKLQLTNRRRYGLWFSESENGVHRLVRVSPYNAQGKRMTVCFGFCNLVDDSTR